MGRRRQRKRPRRRQPGAGRSPSPGWPDGRRRTAGAGVAAPPTPRRLVL